MTHEQIKKLVDEFIAYKTKQKALGKDVTGLAMQLLGSTQAQYQFAINYYKSIGGNNND